MPVVSDDRRKELMAVFTKHDQDNSGDIDAKELRAIFLDLGVGKSPEQISKILTMGDIDSSGTLNFEQFENLFSTAKLQDAFKQYDLDGSGSIGKEEIRKVMNSMGYKMSKAQCLAMIRKVDIDGDNEISFEEFVSFFKNLPLASMDEVAAYWSAGVIATDCGSDVAPTVPLPGCGMFWWQTVVSGGIGGVLSRTLTAPLEKIKINAQTGNATGGGIVRELFATYQTQGLRALFAGNLANCIRVFPTAGITCTAYLNLLALTPADKELDAMEPLYRMGCAGTAALIGNAITYPLDLVRTRLTVASTADGGPGLLGCMRDINRAGGGISAFYKGLGPTLLMVAPFIAMQNTTIDLLRDQAIEHEYEPSTALLFGIGCMAGISAQSLVYPLDVVRRRMQMASANTNVTADSMWLSMRNIVQTSGWKTLYAGIGATFLKTMPSVGVVALVTQSLNMYFKKQNKLVQTIEQNAK